MADFSKIAESDRLDVDIPVRPYLADHRFEGRPVYPAVEAMATLTDAVSRVRPEIDVTRMADIRFDKFLSVPVHEGRIDAFVDLSPHKSNGLKAVLATRAKIKNRKMSRVKNHAAIVFPGIDEALPRFPLDLVASLEGPALLVSPGDLYRDLVPFGPAFQNLRGSLVVSAGGVLMTIQAGSEAESPPNVGPLGSPFSLDAAFHGACVWGQRYAGIVAFPTGIERRAVLKPTRPGGTYFGRVFPRSAASEMLVFDICIHDREGRLREIAMGVRMRDVSGGRLTPPGWIREGVEIRGPVRLARRCTAFSLVELDSVAPFAEKALSPEENARLGRMGERRRRSFIAARMALKRITRSLSDGDRLTDPQKISTVFLDRPHPKCSPDGDLGSVACSASHDSRFAVAVAARGKIGVDVEEMSDRVFKCGKLFMTATEHKEVMNSPLGESAAALRIWSAKEAVSKALEIPLGSAWHRVEVSLVEEYESRVRVDGQDKGAVVHDRIDTHLFTLFNLP